MVIFCCVVLGGFSAKKNHHPVEGQLPEIFLPGGVVPELPLEPFLGLLSWFRMGKNDGTLDQTEKKSKL
jgi:hypothetical protein